MLTAQQKASFERDGFVYVRGLAPLDAVERMRAVVSRDAAEHIGPLEYEAELGYPGAPESKGAEGGKTIRRLRMAMFRDPVFQRIALGPEAVGAMRSLLGPHLVLPLGHHNCVMLKDPKYSSDTGWHQDVRYWRFTRPELVNLQLCLDHATPVTGALHFLPGSHVRTYSPEQFDEQLFLREDVETNQALIASATSEPLGPGDAVLFHCRTFHAATRNRSGWPTRSLILTYRATDNPPTPGGPSSHWPELIIPA